MPLVADTHVHLYPFYDANRLFLTARAHLAARFSGVAARLLVLTERFDCAAFERLRDGQLRLSDFDVERAGNTALILRHRDGALLYVIAGRQIETRERIEILAPATDVRFPDGEPIRDTIQRVRDAGSMPVLAWGLGKWLFKRGAIVSSILREAARGALLIGDSTMRPTLWPTPELMSFGSTRGMKVLAGSDPLPAPGEERMAGRYASFFDTAFDGRDAGAEYLAILRDPEILPVNLGHRSSVFEVCSRNRSAKRARVTASS